MSQKMPEAADLQRITAAADGDIPASNSQTFGAAWADLKKGLAQRELWLALGWQDIKQRYRRSTLGPLWITIATGVMALALGLLYSLLFQQDLASFLPHVAVGITDPKPLHARARTIQVVLNFVDLDALCFERIVRRFYV